MKGASPEDLVVSGGVVMWKCVKLKHMSPIVNAANSLVHNDGYFARGFFTATHLVTTGGSLLSQ